MEMNDSHFWLLNQAVFGYAPCPCGIEEERRSMPLIYLVISCEMSQRSDRFRPAFIVGKGKKQGHVAR
ncbi:hypothetical protein RA280_04895 [Cupriavidus sp. CV2]|uniref:hypothetical protein n=1 Tax=Cupriavidus ulmosensis TaxID=3065913 RepID=UPI00296AD0DF|nr:hypothetical protein [Cupriavidus sp. CV2]MDW3681092.1 hypothetical protein [Cupriavidus sp. CV2]